jgi:hypothetical protein
MLALKPLNLLLGLAGRRSHHMLPQDLLAHPVAPFSKLFVPPAQPLVPTSQPTWQHSLRATHAHAHEAAVGASIGGSSFVSSCSSIKDSSSGTGGNGTGASDSSNNSSSCKGGLLASLPAMAELDMTDGISVCHRMQGCQFTSARVLQQLHARFDMLSIQIVLLQMLFLELMPWVSNFCQLMDPDFTTQLQTHSSSSSSSTSKSGSKNSPSIASTAPELINLKQASSVLACFQKCPDSAKFKEATAAAQKVLNAVQGISQSLLQALPLASLCCSSPGCCNLSGLSELDLAAEGGLCGGCRAARYCSRACQQQDWPAHKGTCKAHSAGGSEWRKVL